MTSHDLCNATRVIGTRSFKIVSIHLPYGAYRVSRMKRVGGTDISFTVPPSYYKYHSSQGTHAVYTATELSY